MYNKLVQKAFSGHFAGSFFHSFSFEPSLMNKPSLPVQAGLFTPFLAHKKKNLLYCLPACLPICSCACQLCFKVGTLIIQVLGTWQQTTVLVWFLFGSALHVWALTGGHVCVILLPLVSCLVLAFFLEALVVGINIFFN